MKLRNTFAASLLGLAAVYLPDGSATAQDAVDPEDMVNAINGTYGTYGSHKGYRAVHAKGFCGAGTLTAGPEAAEYTKSTLFIGVGPGLRPEVGRRGDRQGGGLSGCDGPVKFGQRI